ncbi:hypothetical protein IKG20_02220 [Candidatus Saccharibacteria bacterium]|nr:hypothetical protein [Candidatus Saccharibacteria bacterium]
MFQELQRKHPGLVYKVVFLFTFAAVFTFLAFKLPKNSEAASLANFRPGNIISDYTMSNYTTMSVAEIDEFLHAHGNCRDYDTGKASWYPNLHYHIKDGHFVCLAEERFAKSGSNYGDLLGSNEASQSAAEIIYEVSQEYHINPQVFIVLLEKEQGLISDSWPNNVQFRAATGFGCPDTAPCDAEYYGLKNQLESAAWLFRTVLDGGWTNYPVGPNYIKYNPNSACGGSVVNVENLATSSLYRYTPYQPNAAALAAGYGTVTCGAYGNRNFYLFFMDWFGDPTDEGDKPTEEQLEAKEKIDERFEEVTNAEKLLGNKTSMYPNCSIGHDNACVQAYENGVIITSELGTWENYGEIRARYTKLGSVDGTLGFPVSKINCSIGHDGACAQAFENGVIIQTKKYGAVENTGEIRARFLELGSVDGVLGFPIATTNCNIGYKDACVQAFENGVIISNPKTGTWENYGEIRRRFINNGSIDGHFGFPITGIVCDEDGGCYQDFEERAIFEDSEGNYWISEGEIADRYQDVDEILGGAIANINCNIGHAGACVQAFENGVVISSPKTGSWESYGTIRQKHIESGSIDGKLGFPISGISIDKETGKIIQEFENGELSAD